MSQAQYHYVQQQLEYVQQQWERAELTQQLNLFAAQGWRAVSVVPVPEQWNLSPRDWTLLVLLERPKPSQLALEADRVVAQLEQRQ